MVSVRRKIRFWAEEVGTALTEGLIVFPLILLMIAAFFEFGYAVYQYNQTVKALQYGARRAAVSYLLIDDVADLTSGFGSDAGVPVPYDPANIVSVSCGPGKAACLTAQLNRLVYGSDGECNINLDKSMPGMCDYNDRIAPENVLITYHVSGLGFVGRPGGPVVTITVELRNLNFELPFMGALLGLGPFPIPANPVTVTSEDLSSTDDVGPEAP